MIWSSGGVGFNFAVTLCFSCSVLATDLHCSAACSIPTDCSKVEVCWRYQNIGLAASAWVIGCRRSFDHGSSQAIYCDGLPV